MNEPLAGTSGLPDDQSVTGECPEHGAGSLPGRPSTSREEYNRVVFLARVVLGFTVVAAATLIVIALTVHRDYLSIVVSIVMVAAAVFYYVRTTRAVKRDLDIGPELGE